MTTVQKWCERTRSHLMSGRNEERNTISALYTAGSGTMTFSGSLGGIVANIRLSIGLNTFYVRSVNQAGLTASVLGGQEGTTDANAASGSIVRVGPRFTDAEILGALQAEVADLSTPDNGLWQIVFEDFTYSPSTDIYRFITLPTAADLIDVYEVRASSGADLLTASWFLLPKNYWRLDRVGTNTGMPSLQIFYPAGGNGITLRVLYRAPFGTFDDLTDTWADTGMPTTATDIPPLGAAMRLMVPREIKRNFTENQGDTRRAVEVDAGNIAASLRPLAALRQQRIQSEAARMVAAYPDRRF